MPSHFYAPTKQDRFAFGLWCLQNRGRDPFGDQTRPELPALEAIKGLARRNCYGFEFHDNDVLPFGAAAAQRDQILRDVKKVMADTGIRATMATTNTFYHPVFKDGAFTSTDPAAAHIKVAGLNPDHDFAQALDAGKLLDVHLNCQKALRFDQDLSFGSDDLKEAFFTTKLLADHQYPGTVGFDAHPYRSEADPWDFVDRNMRTFKIMKEKVRRFNENKEIQDLLKEVHGANANLRGFTAKYSKEAAQKLKEMPLDPEALAKRKLPYERLDQLLTELLLGVL